MAFNSLVGVVTIGIGFLKQNIFATILGIWWFFIPMVMWYISKEKMKKAPIELLDNKEKQYVLDIGRKLGSFLKYI